MAANTIHKDAVGIFTAGPVKVRGRSTNVFVHVARHVAHIATFS